MNVDDILIELKRMGNKDHYEQLSKFGINNSNAIGIKVPVLRAYAKKIGKNHDFSVQLWESGIHEARLLASMIENPKLISENQIDKWVSEFNSWDICDTVSVLIGDTPYVFNKIYEYANSDKVFIKRTAFVLICELAIHYKNLDNELFLPYFELIEREAWDERNFVRKAVNWALRQIGKRNEFLRIKAIESAERIYIQGTKSAKLIASDAIRELKSERVVQRLNK